MAAPMPPYKIARQKHAGEQLTLLAGWGLLRWRGQYDDAGMSEWWIKPDGRWRRYGMAAAEHVIQQINGLAGIVWEPVPHPGGSRSREPVIARIAERRAELAARRGLEPEQGGEPASWAEQPLLPPAHPPEPKTIRTDGAKLINVLAQPGAAGGVGEERRAALVLAFAPLSNGTWAGLTAWTAPTTQHADIARWGWCHLPPDRVEPATPEEEPSPQHWLGVNAASELGFAIEAAATAHLPERLQALAQTPSPSQGHRPATSSPTLG